MEGVEPVGGCHTKSAQAPTDEASHTILYKWGAFSYFYTAFAIGAGTAPGAYVNNSRRRPLYIQ